MEVAPVELAPAAMAGPVAVTVIVTQTSVTGAVAEGLYEVSSVVKLPETTSPPFTTVPVTVEVVSVQVSLLLEEAALETTARAPTTAK